MSSNEQTVSELIACPFCGQKDAFVEQLDSDASVVICQGRVDEYSACLARGPVGVQQSHDEVQPGYAAAVAAWNLQAKQHQGELVAWVIDTPEGRGADYYCGKGLDLLEPGTKLYSRPDAGEWVALLSEIADEWGSGGQGSEQLWGRIRAAISASVEPSTWQPLTAPGQIQQGDWLCFTVSGRFICAQARLLIDAGTDREEVVYNRKENHYFCTDMAIDGTSNHKNVLVAAALERKP